MQTIYLDISNRGVIPAIYAKQGDVGRKVEVVLTNSGLPYEPEAGSAFSAWYSGASGMGNYTDIGGKSAFAVSGNKVTVELITQMLQNAGEGILCMVLSRANGDQIGLWNIRYICEGVPGAGSEPAKDYYTAFSQAVAGLPYPDLSLSAPGKAADAAAVGTALAGKAPAGYGLGEPMQMVLADSETDLYNKLDAILATLPDGTSKFVRISCSAVFGIGYTFNCELHNAFNGYATLRGVSYNGLQFFIYKDNGNWFVEWVNPPMVPGVEYRTTERWNGKPVYTMLINCGNMPTAGNTNRIDMPSTICGWIDRVLCANGSDSSGNSIPYSWQGEYITEVSASRSAIYIYAKDDFSNNTADVQIWYVRHQEGDQWQK